ncbi:MAG: putative DNA binding domain-containing protein, partial [Bacteroidales bacterium]|nr:putative DNA binding domain-containing protein [Bacteroidales bacterium]
MSKIMNYLPDVESLTVEFKTSFNDDVIISLVAFSNAVGGEVYVGIADNGEVKGVSTGKETIAGWINEIKNKTAPIIIPDVEIIEIDGKTIVVFKVFEYPIKPVSMKGRYYKRVKNTNLLLTVTDVVNLHLQSINSSWDAYPDTLHTLDDISLEKVQNCIEMMREKGITIIDSPLSFLLKFNLLRENRPTNAAYLMFKNSHSIVTTIELGRFQDNITIKDTARTQSDIITQVNEVMEFVKKHINLEIIITGEAQNIQKWQYPLEAIREIVLNMIVHRDYRSSSDSIVKIFNDKIEFYNPGKLPDDITIEDLLSNNYISNPRNKAVADFFKNLGWIEKYGSGIGRIKDYFKEAGLPEPKFGNISDGFKVTIFVPETLINVIEDGANVIENETNVIE